MAILVTQVISPAGLAPAFVAATVSGDKVPPGADMFLHVKNTGAQVTVTIDSTRPCQYGFDHDLAVVVPATTGDRMIGPLSSERFAGADGLVNVTYSAVTGVTVAAIKVASS